MKKNLIITLIIVILCFSQVFSQQSYLKNRYNFKLGISSNPKMDISGLNPINLRIEANYGIIRVIEAGTYMGIGYFRYYDPSAHNGRMGSRVFSPFFGIQSNFHMLPLLIKKPDFRFDLYLTAKFGGHYFNVAEDSEPPRGLYSEYGLGAGLAFYLWKHLGIYAEYSFGKYSYYTPPFRSNFDKSIKPNLRFGITYKYNNILKKQ